MEGSHSIAHWNDFNGETPLHYCTKCKSEKEAVGCASQLLEHCKKYSSKMGMLLFLNQENDKGKTATDLATDANWSEFVSLCNSFLEICVDVKLPKKVGFNVQICSDLHTEFYQYNSEQTSKLIKPSAPYLALLGDIGICKDKGFIDFIKALSKLYKHIFLLAGIFMNF